MNEVLEGVLRMEYSYMFKDVPDNMPVNFDGIEAPDGWYDLINNTLRKIEMVDPDKQFRVHQIKEKFAGLRLYGENYNDQIWKIISEAEKESFKVCEECGSTENVKLRGGRWLNTICDKCFNKVIK